MQDAAEGGGPGAAGWGTGWGRGRCRRRRAGASGEDGGAQRRRAMARWHGAVTCGADRSGAVRRGASRTSRHLPLVQRLQPPARMPRRTHCAHCSTGTHRVAFGATHCARSHPRVPPHYHPRWPAPCVPALPPAAPARYRAACRAVAQFGSATGLGPVGRRFKSGQPDQFRVRRRFAASLGRCRSRRRASGSHRYSRANFLRMVRYCAMNESTTACAL